MKCSACHDQQKKQDERRKGRVRNYGRERYRNPLAHIEMYKTSAEKRGISFNLTLEQFKEIIVRPCFYCGHNVEEEAIGIDRFNNSLPYDLSNCKPCCEPCNRIKYTYHPRFFVEKCKAIADARSVPINLAVKWPEYYSRSVGIQFSKYKASAKKRHLPFELTEDQFHWFVNHPCSYCRQEGPCGLDRLDNALGYTATNVQACCMTCNMMRKDNSVETFIEHVRKVAAFWPDDRMTFIDTDSSDVAHTRTRTIWKAASLYLAIMSNTDSQFTKQYADSIDEVKYAEIRAFAVSNTKGVAIARIRTFLASLKKKRYRHAAKHTVDESHIDHI